jgi:branched-chain amino acid transport system substrate-binding protein
MKRMVAGGFSGMGDSSAIAGAASRWAFASADAVGQFARRMGIFRRSFIASSLALPLTAGAAGAEGAAETQPVAAAKIGVLLPLSGPDALLGDECLRGVQLAVDAANAASGQNLSLVTADAFDEVQAEQTARSLISADQLNLLLGSGASSLAYPGSDAAELAQIPYIELNAPADGITGRNFKFLVRTTLTTSMQAALALDTIAKRFAGKQIGLLFNTGASAGAVAAAALARWQAAKISPLLVIGYPADVADLHEPVRRMQRAGVQVVLHAGGMDDVLVLFQALQDTGWRPEQIIGCGEGYGFRETAFALGEIFDGVLVCGAPCYPPQAATIAAAYATRFGMTPRSADSLTSYAGAKFVLDTLGSVGGDSSKLLDALRKTVLPAGSLANGWGFALDRTGQNSQAFAVLQQWRGGALVAVAPS